MSDSQFNPNAEQWKEISEYPGYEVSDHGRVRSYWRNAGANGFIKENTPQKILKPYCSTGNYPRIPLRKDKKCKSFRLHQLVLSAFVGPCPIGMECCHKDGDGNHNHLINLRYDTPKNNTADKFNHGTVVRGESITSHKLIESQVIEIRQLALQGYSHSKISTFYNVCRANITYIVNRKTWTHI